MPTKLTGADLKVVFATKFFVSVPDPIFDQFVEQRLSRTAMLVHMVHLKAGAIDGAYCSEIPIRVVAERCRVSPSQVSRAYQELRAAGLIERIDPGRDASRPMQQAVALTQCCLPPALVHRLGTYPNRARRANHSPAERETVPPAAANSPASAAAAVSDPLKGLTGRERRAALDRLLEPLSPAERARYHEAACHSAPKIEFDAGSQAPEQTRRTVLQLLARCAQSKPEAPRVSACSSSPSPTQVPRRISMTQLADLRRGLQRAAGTLEVDELLRQVVWSVLHGALQKHTVVHGLRLGVKLVRNRVWTRPHRMPPNWALKLIEPPQAPGPVARAAPAPKPPTPTGAGPSSPPEAARTPATLPFSPAPTADRASAGPDRTPARSDARMGPAGEGTKSLQPIAHQLSRWQRKS